jgi:hypothetical protein
MQTKESILAIDPQTGDSVWRRKIVDPLAAQLCGPHVLFCRRITWEPAGNLRVPELVWLDGNTGRQVATHPIAEMKHDWPRFAGLIAHGNRLWGIFGRGEDRYRMFAELIRTGDAAPAAHLDDAPDGWRAHVPEPLEIAARTFLPNWRLLSGGEGNRTGLLVDVNGEKDVLGVSAQPDLPVVFGREIVVPELGQPRLKLRVSSESGRNWRLEVRFRGESVVSQEISAGNRWTDLAVDLQQFKSQKGILTVHGQLLQGEQLTDIFWKTLQLLY